MPHPNDVCIWPDGTRCYREDLHEYGWMSDDYETFPAELFDGEDIDSFQPQRVTNVTH
jgi:hypothetical protein